MRVKHLGTAFLLLAAAASVARSQTSSTAPLIATPVSAPGPGPSYYPTGSAAPFTPGQIQEAYGFNTLFANTPNAEGAGQTIAIVDAYNYPGALSTINTFCSTFNSISDGAVLPLMTTASFTQLNQTGGTMLPGTDPAGPGNDNWEFEEALDIEWAHVMAPQAKIILYEANDNSNDNLYQAVTTAASNSAVSVISMSWGGGLSGNDSLLVTPSGRLALKQGVTFVGATGDSGAPGIYPAYSPNVVAAGGTSLTLAASSDPTGTAYGSESAWGSSSGSYAGGGGTASTESKPSYQINYGISHGGLLSTTTVRAIPDLSFDADPNTGVYTYDPYNGGYFEVGGTSLASPSLAGMFADADSLRLSENAGYGTLDGPSETLPALYSLPSTDFTDITSGSNATVFNPGYAAGPGYDLATGIGTPIANKLVPDLADAFITPEPSTLALLSIAGMMAIGQALRRRRLLRSQQAVSV